MYLQLKKSEVLINTSYTDMVYGRVIFYRKIGKAVVKWVSLLSWHK
jgi:hypothetical protein